MPRSNSDTSRYSQPYEISAAHRMQNQLQTGRVRHFVETLPAEIRFQFLPHYWGSPPKWRLRLRSLSRDRTLPDFLCIGAIKSGTSDLSTYLFQHPSIIPPLTKEILSDRTDEWRVHYPTVREKATVRSRTGTALSGYFAPWMHHYQLADSYLHARPDGKVVLILRDPTDRAYSHYKWEILVGGPRIAHLDSYRTYADFVDTSLDLFPSLSLPSGCGVPVLATGIYHRSVQLWIETFGRDNVHIVSAENFFSDRRRVVCDIHRFLGLPPIAPELHDIVNQNPVTAPPETEGARAKMREFYRPWNEKLYELIGEDLGWPRS